MSFYELVKKISPTLKRITHRLNGRFTFFNEDDLEQEALLHLWVSFKRGKLGDKTESYILQGCYFHLKNYIRKVQDKAKLISLDKVFGEEGMGLEEMLPVEDTRDYFGRIEANMLLEDILNSGLSEREKEILSLCLEGLTVREVGIRLGISHVRVVKVKNNLRKKLKKFFE